MSMEPAGTISKTANRPPWGSIICLVFGYKNKIRPLFTEK